jgi:hypothetical protein
VGATLRREVSMMPSSAVVTSSQTLILRNASPRRRNYNSHLWEMPRLLWATEVPTSRSGGPLGRNIEALGFDDAIIVVVVVVVTSSQTPILRNASPPRNYNSHRWEIPCLLWATEEPSRSRGGPLGRNIEALGFDDAIIGRRHIFANTDSLQLLTTKKLQ